MFERNQFSVINETDLSQISGGRRIYIPGGNGAWIDSKTGKGGINWNIAGPALGHIIGNGWAQNGPLSHLYP
ncbi:bacteriocin [Leuconostoc pseudomesenteroides]|uniref:bacteriocin n=1 Tax=Leuconostoc pseudomesenteroides TaxID=33968 RepID=UPI0032DFAE22